MDAQVKNLMLCQDITYKKLSTIKGNGDKTYNAEVIIKGYQVDKKVLITSKEGEKVLSTCQVFVDGPLANTIKTDDLIKLQNDTIFYPVVKVQVFYKERNFLDYGILYLS